MQGKKKTKQQTQTDYLIKLHGVWEGGRGCGSPVMFVAISRSQAVKVYDPNWHHLSTLAPKQEIN
jgi:hypothetical protein